ncbi:MAG: helix-turn-helix transcriptional regulator [Longispora sp.]|nr:helix-turn-helix transcriptional regulator [Longispora sp. (in: high G+C Gram-positive bacteria)]
MTADEAADDPNLAFDVLIRDARLAKGWTQEELAVAAGVTRQLVNRYESGKSANPQSDETRRVCLALDIDPREVPIALGYVTREEMRLPPREPRLAPELRRAQRLLTDSKIPEALKDLLHRGINSAIDLWFDALKIRAPHEPSAKERIHGREHSVSS